MQIILLHLDDLRLLLRREKGEIFKVRIDSQNQGH